MVAPQPRQGLKMKGKDSRTQMVPVDKQSGDGTLQGLPTLALGSPGDWVGPKLRHRQAYTVSEGQRPRAPWAYSPVTNRETKAERSRGPPEDTHPNRTEELGLPIQATCPCVWSRSHAVPMWGQGQVMRGRNRGPHASSGLPKLAP